MRQCRANQLTSANSHRHFCSHRLRGDPLLRRFGETWLPAGVAELLQSLVPLSFRASRASKIRIAVPVVIIFDGARVGGIPHPFYSTEIPFL